MPQVRNYKKGSIIYFDGETKNNFAYLLKSGACTRTKLAPETVQPERTRVNVGEFFGIKAALGVLQRDEMIQVAADSVVYVFTPREFEDVIKKNVTIIFKMLKAFSNELRRIHKAVENLLHADGGGSGSDSGLMGIGTYYLSQKKYRPAKYAFQKFLQHHGSSEEAAEAKQNLEMIDEALQNEGGGEADADAGGDEAEAPAPKAAAAQWALLETPQSFQPEAGDLPEHKLFKDLAFIYNKRNSRRSKRPCPKWKPRSAASSNPVPSTKKSFSCARAPSFTPKNTKTPWRFPKSW
ncbi:MAG: Crp/Fnr family transcriptional regulator [Spirochaetia bacterium]|nr:Crp/Fnr family transcriptional regulator [Spirochaetia bacterium]